MPELKPIRIAVNGLAGSGKSIVARRLCEHHGFEHASSGAICRSITAQLFGDCDRENLNKVSQAIRSIDTSLWIRAALRAQSSTRIVFDSVRYRDDAACLANEGFLLWRVECPINICVERLIARGQTFTMADFDHPSEAVLPSDLFTTFIKNDDRSLTEVYAEIDRAIDRIS